MREMKVKQCSAYNSAQYRVVPSALLYPLSFFYWLVKLEECGDAPPEVGGADTSAPRSQKPGDPRFGGPAAVGRARLKLGGLGDQAGVARHARMRAEEVACC